MIDDKIKTLTEELIQRGTTYDLDFLENVYDDSLKFTRVLPDESVEVLSKEENIRFFQSLKKSNAAPLNTKHPILFADNDGKTGTIILKRRMQQLDKEQDFLFNITWNNSKGVWKIVREVVFLIA
ncbi:nuclear transport factor 2 family protein [Enterococcus faecalis]|uniref:nuclear transport factor 2 family protein n=1 Tax=Enterococcus faecalis TaxID=1351 RepID=UPI002935D703|nr:nuclear transport factor 2 family protein [Enterococcus faecalis]MDV2517207.1 nuclear transport factor 2 family protein [Enterococcus faecalis]MDV2541872.1 nuclear transport factor 2 family protein [Enterococcus faecalis]MDV2589610.1 nuclear transport factor 2 family protein [Enterococcus faecalis]